MERPQVRYARSADGTDIAYTAVGAGPPLVWLVSPPLPLTMSWRVPGWEEFWNELAEGCRLILPDWRGEGLSGDHVGPFSMDASLDDLAAVTTAEGGRVAMIACSTASSVALRFAIERPGAVGRLILWCASIRPRGRSVVSRAVSELMPTDPNAAGKLLTHLMAGTSRETVVYETEEVMSALRNPAYAAEVREVANSWSNESLALTGIHTPTLILHRREIATPPLRDAVELARLIPGARLEVLEGDSMITSVGESAVPAILAFLRDGATAGKAAREESAAAPRTMLFTDLERHSGMMSRLGDRRGRAVLREHERITRAALDAYGGVEVKTMGDGFLASFASSENALNSAVTLQKGVASGIAGEALRIRIGINAGEPISENDDLFGTSVIAAARIAARAEGGEILVANVVRELVSGKGFLFADTGEHVLKGLEDPVRIWQLRWKDADSPDRR